MSKIDKSYHDLIKQTLSKGFVYEDPNRKGIKRTQITNHIFEHNFENGFPAITTKQLYWKGIIGELLWILRGETNIKYLVDNGINIWNKDAYNYYLKQNPQGTKEQFEQGIDKNNHIAGDLGRVYGYQLRNFGGKFDQLKWIIETLKTNPLSTKKTVSFINPNDKELQALTPCHTGFKILVEPYEAFKYCSKLGSPKYQFKLQWEQDSVDTFLGLPFNIASYGVMAQLIGKMTNTISKGIIGDLSNVHIYAPHLDAINTQLNRSVNMHNSECVLEFSKDFDEKLKHYHKDNDLDKFIDSLKISDFNLSDHFEQSPIKAEMLPYSN